jgi:hypothetical protein
VGSDVLFVCLKTPSYSADSLQHAVVLATPFRLSVSPVKTGGAVLFCSAQQKTDTHYRFAQPAVIVFNLQVSSVTVQYGSAASKRNR